MLEKVTVEIHCSPTIWRGGDAVYLYTFFSFFFGTVSDGKLETTSLSFLRQRCCQIDHFIMSAFAQDAESSESVKFTVCRQSLQRLCCSVVQFFSHPMKYRRGRLCCCNGNVIDSCIYFFKDRFILLT